MEKDSIQKLLKDRYYLKNENTWTHIATRVSAIYPPIFDLINEMKFIPSTPTLLNANTNGERQGTLSSCFTMGLEDSIEGIFDAVKEAAIVTKAGGGVGYDYSVLRSNKEKIKSLDRMSSGPLPFMEVFNSTLDGIQQGGVRRGAGMGMIRIDHENILDFIRVKKQKGKLERMNLSIKVTDEFYERLKNNPDAPHYVKSKNGLTSVLEEDGKAVTVKQLWNEIIHYAWACAEPGILNEDIMFNQCTVTNLSNQVLTNPCQPAFATVLTPNGIKTIGEIGIGDTIWSGKQWTKVINKWFTGHKQVYSYNTTVGSFVGTENHRIVQNGKKIEVKDATSIDRSLGIVTEEINKVYDKQSIMDGLVIGDGSIHKTSSDLVYLCIGDNDYDYFDSEISSYIVKNRTIAFKTGYEIETTITSDELPKTYDRVIPERFFKGNRVTVESFLRGLYSANGSICGGRVTLKQTSLKLVKQVQEMLSSLGIPSYYISNKSKPVEFANGTYTCKESYDLNITKGKDVFYRSIGFLQKYKMNKLKELIENQKPPYKNKVSYDINSIDDLGFHDVFDMTVEAEEHTYWTSGLLVSNCSEYVNIPYSSCNLASLNLRKFVVDGIFQWDEFIQTIKLATRFLDNVIDVNVFPLEKIEKITKAVRPIGLGFMGLAHAMFLMNIPFNSKEGSMFRKKIAQTLTLESMKESIEMSKEKGAYEAFDLELYLKANKRFWNEETEDLKQSIINDNIRNSCNTSLAPTGSISFIADTSGGVEPVFALTFARKIEKLNKEYDVVFITDPIFEEYLNNNFDEKTKIKILSKVANDKGSCQKVEEIPEDIRKVFVTATDLTPMEHLESLADVAPWISTSCSKCVSKDSLIYTDKGLTFIRDISHNRTEDAFSELDISIFNYKGEQEKTKSFYYNGIKECKKITLSNGIQFTATNSHRIMIDDGLWKTMENLCVGDLIK